MPKWQKTAVILGLTLAVIFSISRVSFAAPPSIISYQGRLTNAAGDLLGGSSGTTYYFRFAIFSDAAGGTQLWPAGTPAVVGLTVQNGVFNAAIGDTAAGFDALTLDFETDPSVYLQIQISSSISFTSPETLTPRQRIVSSGYAINADTVDGAHAGTSANNVLRLGSSAEINLAAFFDVTGTAAPAVSSAGEGRIYFDSTTNTFRVSQNGAAYANLVGGGSGSSAWDDLTAPDANLSLAMAEFTTAWNWNTADTAAALDALTLTLTNDASTDSTTQRLMVLRNASATGGTTERLLVLDNADDSTVTTGIEIVGSSTGAITTAIDVSDSQIVNAINIGGGNFALFDGVRIFEGSTGTLTIEDTSGNDLLTVVDGGTVGNVTITGTLSTAGNIAPTANDGASLGIAGTAFSDLFLADGGVINWANGNAILTHSTGILTVSPGDLRVTTAGTNTASVVTVGGIQTLTSKTLTSPSLTSPTITTSPTAVGATWADLGTVTTADINGGTIDGTTIGATTPAAGTFTTIVAENAGLATRFRNTTDSASVETSRFEGIRATQANGDIAYLGLRLKNSAAAAFEYARIGWVADDVIAGTEDGTLQFSVVTANALAAELNLSGTALSPFANDGLALGVSGTAYSDLFLASGGVINWNASDVTLTHSANALTVAGGTLTLSDALDANSDVSIADTNIAFDGASATFTVTGAFTLTPGGAVILGDGGDTMQIDTSDWDIDATGAITGVSFDANGTGNSISNIESADIVDGTITSGDIASNTVASVDILDSTVSSADIAADTIDFVDIIDAADLDADLSIAAGTGEEITVNKTYTNATGENGLVLNFTASDTTGSTTAQYGLYLDNVASTEGLDAHLVIDNSDADDATAAGILFVDGGGGFTTGINMANTIITNIGNAGTDFTSSGGLNLVGALAVDPTTTGTFLDFELATQWTTGTLINADFASATTQTGAITGLNLDFGSNVTGANGANQIGIVINTIGGTYSGAGTENIRGISVSGPALTQQTAAGNIEWNGGYFATPNITQSTGSIDARGLYVATGSITTGGTQRGVYISAGGANTVGSVIGVGIDLSGGGGTATETALSIGTGWDTDINAATSLEVGIGGTNELYLDGDDFSPATSDGSALGTTALMWGDLFLASGGVINFNNGDVTLTHSSNTLAVGGATLVDVAAGVLEMNDQIRFDTGTAVTAGNYSVGRNADVTNLMQFNVPTGSAFEFSVNDVAYITGGLGAWNYAAGASFAGGAANYIIGRNNDATNLMQYNVPTGASHEFSVNDVTQMTLSATAVNFQDNSITTTGGGSLTGTWSDLGTVTTVDINGGTLDGVVIGGASAAAATVTTLSLNNQITWTAGAAVTAGSYQVGRDADGTNQLHFNVPTGAGFEWSVNDSPELVLNATNLQPGADDGLALGVSGTAFSDLFLASGAVINFAAGDVTLTHAANALTLAGAESLTMTQAAGTTGVPVGITFTGAAHTGLTSLTTLQDININLARTLTWAGAGGELGNTLVGINGSATYAFAAATNVIENVVTIQGGGKNGANSTILESNVLELLVDTGYAGTTWNSLLALDRPSIQTGIGAVTTYTLIGVPTDTSILSNQTATLTNLNQIRLEAQTYTSTTNTRTVTNPATIYVANAPIASTNVTFTNGPYALFVDAGAARFDGPVAFGAQQSLTANSTTPSVSAGSHVITANTTNPTLISNFTSGHNGQALVVELGDSVTDFDCTASNLNCGGADITTGATGDIFTFMYDGTNWNLINWMDTSATQTGADIAEYMYADTDIAPGTVVVAHPTRKEAVTIVGKPYDATVVGIVSDLEGKLSDIRPGLVLGEGRGNVPITLAGRVMAVFDAANGLALPGDPLTTSTNGRLMVAKKAGPIVGKALSMSENGYVVAMVSVGWYNPTDLSQVSNEIAALREQVKIAQEESAPLELTLETIQNLAGRVSNLETLSVESQQEGSILSNRVQMLTDAYAELITWRDSVDTGLTALTDQVDALNINFGALNVETTGVVSVGFNNTETTNGVCHSGADIDAATNETRDLVACSGAPGSYAEWYETAADVEVGDVVVLSEEAYTYKTRAFDPFTGMRAPEGDGEETVATLQKSDRPYSPLAFGVVSTYPAQTIGGNVKEQGTHPLPIAIVGRVPVKVTDENGPVEVGDYLTASSQPGVAMRATKSGRVIGQALEKWEPGKKTVMMLVQNFYWGGGADLLSATENSDGTVAQSNGESVNLGGASLIGVGEILSANGTWSIDPSGNLTIKTVRAEEVKAQKLTFEGGKVVGHGYFTGGQTSARVDNTAVTPDALVFVTFRLNPEAYHWVSEVGNGYFIVSLSSPAGADYEFDYWIINTDGQFQNAVSAVTAAPAASVAPATEESAAQTESVLEPVAQTAPVEAVPAEEPAPSAQETITNTNETPIVGP